jgi:glycosyltransferase involved in cell wall biosynthesis
VGGGRIGPQKDADYFLDCADLLLDSGIDCELVWIGGGADEDEQKLRNARIRVTGWLDRREVLAELVNADVYLHTAAWEGFPVAILEAASLGLPVVARSIPAFEGVALPLLLEKPTDVVEVCRALLDPDVRTRAASDTRLALQRNTLASQGEVLRKIYAGTTSNQSWEK